MLYNNTKHRSRLARIALLLSAVFLSMSLSAVSPAWAAPKVVVSLLPIHSLVAGVMSGVGAPDLIVQGGASPHSYALKPSEAGQLQRADIVFWIGEDLETFLAKPLRALAPNAIRITLSEVPEMRLLAAREGGAWRVGTNEDHHTHAEHDLHLWLDPTNAATIVRSAVTSLSELDPANAKTYSANGEILHRRLRQLETRVRGHLVAVKDRPYVVFHDAYQYFERAFGTNAVGAISVSPGRSPGARRLTRIRQKVATSGATCVFTEPQFEPALVATVIEGAAARAGVLDPLGVELAPGPDAYFALMDNMARSLRACLARPS